MGTRRTQQEIDDEARASADASETEALDELARTGSVTAPRAPRRVELDITPEESRTITNSAFGDMSLDEPTDEPTDEQGDGSAGEPGTPEPLEEQYNPTSGSRTSDYGAQGMREMQRLIDEGGARGLSQPWGPAGNAETFGEATDDDPVLPGIASDATDDDSLARDDMEPLGDVARSGSRRGQMFAPSGALGTPEQRFARLGVGGGFAAQLPGDDESDLLDEPNGDVKPERDAERDEAAGPLHTLDEGLPSERDIADARDDVGESILHRIANGLRVATGHQARDYSARGDRLEQQRAQGIERRQTAKGTQRREEAAADRAAITDERAERQLAQGERRLDIADQQAQTQADATRALIGQREAQTEHLTTADEIARATRTDRETSGSTVSDSARRAWLAGIERLPQGAMRERLAAIIPTEELSGMSAAQLEGPLRMLERISVGARGSGGSGGGGTRTAALAQMLVDRHVANTPEEAEQIVASLGADRARALVGQTLTPAAREHEGEATHGRAILPGVYADAELDIGDVEARAIRTDLTHGAQQLGALHRLQQIGDEFGRTGVMSPTAEAEAVAARSTMMAMVADLEGSGIIGPGDLPRITAAIPNPTDTAQAVLGTMPARIRGFRAAIEDSARQQLRLRGVDARSIDAAIRMLNGAAPSRPRAPVGTPSPSSATPSGAPAAPDGGGALWTFPDGSQRRVTPDREARARELGARPPGGA